MNLQNYIVVQCRYLYISFSEVANEQPTKFTHKDLVAVYSGSNIFCLPKYRKDVNEILCWYIGEECMIFKSDKLPSFTDPLPKHIFRFVEKLTDSNMHTLYKVEKVSHNIMSYCYDNY